MKRFIGQHSAEYGTQPEGASFLDAWSVPDGHGRSFFLRVGGLTIIWSSPGAFLR